MTILLPLHQPCVYGTLQKRYKRFLCDVTLDSGEQITAHCPNPGRMIGCSEPGSRVRLSFFDDPKRKYAHRLDLVHNGDCWIGVNPTLANKIVAKAIEVTQLLPQFKLELLQPEVKYHNGHRIDFLHNNDTYIEVKSVTYAQDGVGYFPDAVSKRATDHLNALQAMVKMGKKAVVIYCVQRSDIGEVLPATHIDSNYAEAVAQAQANGVDFMSLLVDFDSAGNHVIVNNG